VQLIYCLDDYSRSITGGEWFFTKSEGNALKVLKDAFKNNGLPKAILSDNGFQFKPTSKHGAQTRYQEIMAMLGINTSYSRPYHPQSKGKIERLHSFIQRDFLWEVRDKVRSLEDLNRRWQRWVAKYNGYSHSSLELDLLFAEEEPRCDVFKHG
jgi:transposase InsO family protein